MRSIPDVLLVTFMSGCKYLFAWLSIRESSERRKRKMLDFTCCVMFFNYWLTEMPGGAELTRQNALNLLLLIVLAVNPGIDNQRHQQNAKHHAERNGDRNMVEIDDQHLDTDKHQNHRQTVLQH